MGLSSSKTKTTSKETATTTPNIEPWVREGVQGWAGQIGQFGKSDPYSFVAGPSQIQQGVFNDVGNFGEWRTGNQNAQNMVQGIAGAGPNFAGFTSYDAPQIANTRIGAPATSQMAGYDPFMTAPAGQVSAPNINVPKLGQAATYEAIAAGGGSSGPAAQAAAERAEASRALQFMNDYQNPYLQQVVDTSLGDYDVNAGRVRAQQASTMARNRAFGGSRSAILEAATEGELSRGRGALDAGLRSDAFKVALGAGDADAARATQTSGLNAQLGTQTNQFNAREKNESSRHDASLATQAGIATAGFQNDARRYGVESKNAFALRQGEMEYGAGLEGARMGLQAGMFNTEAANTNNYRNQDAATRAREFSTNWLNQGRAADRDSANQFALADYSGQLQRNLSQAGLDAESLQSRANAFNRNQEFNTGQRDNALARQMQAAGLLGDLSNSGANNSRADLGLRADIGTQQQTLEQLRLQAPMQYMALMGQLQGSIPYNMFSGQTINSSGTSTGKSSPGLIPMLLQLGNKAASAYAGGAG